jgi:hypothetical protein
VQAGVKLIDAGPPAYGCPPLAAWETAFSIMVGHSSSVWRSSSTRGGPIFPKPVDD